MAQIVPFFPRQTLAFTASGSYYSEVYDTSQNSSLTVEARLYGQSAAATLMVKVQETADPTLEDWEDVTGASDTLSLGAPRAKISAAGLLRFARVVVTSGGSINDSTISVLGTASS